MLQRFAHGFALGALAFWAFPLIEFFKSLF